MLWIVKKKRANIRVEEEIVQTRLLDNRLRKQQTAFICHTHNEKRRLRTLITTAMLNGWRVGGRQNIIMMNSLAALVDIVGLFVSFLTSSSISRLYHGWVSRLASDNFTCCHTRDRARRPCLLSQPVTLY